MSAKKAASLRKVAVRYEEIARFLEMHPNAKPENSSNTPEDWRRMANAMYAAADKEEQ